MYLCVGGRGVSYVHVYRKRCECVNVCRKGVCVHV